VIGQAIAMLKQDPLMSFRIEIAADSLVMIDEREQQQQRVEFLSAAGGFLREAVSAYQSAPALGPLLSEMLLFGVRGFKVGRQIEGKFAQYIEQMGQQAQQERPDPEAMKVQADAQMEQARMQADMQVEQQKMQMDAALAQQKMQSEERIAQMKAEMQMQIEALKMQAEQTAKPSATVNIDGKEQIGEVAQALQALGADQATRMEVVGTQMGESVAVLSQASDTIAQAASAIAQAAQTLSAPRRVVRGLDGRVAGMEVVQ
jgi:hypothetical protein